jgi:hypothetical protein
LTLRVFARSASDEAIQSEDFTLDCFAALAMTNQILSGNDGIHGVRT